MPARIHIKSKGDYAAWVEKESALALASASAPLPSSGSIEIAAR
jgi:hypothetical protein